jgi:DnaK suppressor protein
MDPARARELLEGERQRLEQALAALRGGEAEAAAEQDEPGERDSEDLFERGLDDARAEDLSTQMAALERAEARLEAGTYGLSVQSGEPIPDERLEAVPAAERTVAEEERFQRGG